MIIKTPPICTAARRSLCNTFSMIQPKPSDAMISGNTIKKLNIPMYTPILPSGKTPLCISWGHTSGPDWVIDAAGQRFSNLAGSLSGLLDRHVLDKTGVNDQFIYHLQFAHDETTPGPARIVFPPTDIPPGPSIFTILDRLGLKLEQATGPREYVVIDHIERPSEN